MPRGTDQILKEAIAALIKERDEIDRRIKLLQGAVPDGARRGRRSVSASERLAVSKRMKAYWSKRRKERSKGKQPRKSQSQPAKSAEK